jgi:hypothetical protein
MKFDDQSEITNRAEFDATSQILRPIMELFQSRFESAEAA